MPDWVQQLAGYLVAGGAVYAGIRADLATLRTRLDYVEDSVGAVHRRIDRIAGVK